MPFGIRSDRRGFALIAALLAVVCMGAMLVGLAFVARHDTLLSDAARRSQQAFVAAELAAWSAAAALDSSALLAERGDELRPVVTSSGFDTASAAAFRLSESLYLALGEAAAVAAGPAPLRRRVAVLLHVRRDSLDGVSFEPLPERSWLELP